MKRIFTHALAAAALFVSTAAMAQDPIEVIADNASKVTAALTAYYEPGQAVYIKITTADYLNLKNVNLNAAGNIHIIGTTDAEDGRANIGFEMVFPRDIDEEGNYISNKEGDKFSIHFENLKIVDYNGAMANSKHLMNYKDTLEHYIDTLEFKNCEITDICRSMVRGETQARSNGVQYGGTINYFGMTDCKVHYGSMQTNAMPLIYIGQPTSEMVFRNNTFYDLPYLNQLVTFAYMNEDTGRIPLAFTFENNTVCAWPKGTLLNFSSFVDPGSTFSIKNNVFFGPYWSDECNNIDLTEEDIEAKSRRNIAGIQYGVVDISNNLLFNFKGATAVLDEDGNGQWLVGEEVNDLDIDALQLDYANFQAWEDDNFLIAKQGDNLSAFYTAGTNGQPIGDLNNYTDQVIKFAKILATVAGSKSAKIAMIPDQPSYEAGSTVQLIALTNGRLNEFTGWSNGETTDTIEVVVPEEDLEITANFKEMPYVAAWNLEQLEKNNVKLSAPLAPNYGDESVLLKYATWLGEQYVDSLKEALMTRNNKVSGDVRNCFFVHTATEMFALASDALEVKGGNADYAYIDIPEAKAGYQLLLSLATDNVCYKNYAISYSTDGGEKWTAIETIEMNTTGKWNDYTINLPSDIDGKNTLVRIKGVEADGWYSQGFLDGGHELSEVNTEFLFVSELYLVKGDAEDGIQIIATTAADNNMQVYNLMGQKVGAAARGLLIKNGKKVIVK